jgi:hypothetical protein
MTTGGEPCLVVRRPFVAAWKVNYGMVLFEMMGLTSFSLPPQQIFISTGVSL